MLTTHNTNYDYVRENVKKCRCLHFNTVAKLQYKKKPDNHKADPSVHPNLFVFSFVISKVKFVKEVSFKNKEVLRP